MVGADDLAAELLELVAKVRGEAGAVGLLVVDDVDLLDFLASLYRYCAANGPWMASVVAVRKYVLNGRFFLPVLPVRALGQRGVGVGGRDLDQLGVVEDLLHRLGDVGVQRADGTEDVLVGDELGGVLLAGGGLGLVVQGLELERDAVDLLLLVGGLDGEVGGVLDALAERGQVTGQRGVDADGRRWCRRRCRRPPSVVA